MDYEDIVGMTAKIVGAYVSNNPVPLAELPTLIAAVGASVQTLGEAEPEPEHVLVPAVNPKKSVHPEYIISLEDGRHYKTLKRHIKVKYGLTPDEYRRKWGLDWDYPMTAPNYSEKRSRVAKELGLGRKSRFATTAKDHVEAKSKARRKAPA